MIAPVAVVPSSISPASRSSRPRPPTPLLSLLEPTPVTPLPAVVIPSPSLFPTRSGHIRQPNQQYDDLVRNSAICSPIQPQVCVSTAFAFAAIAAHDDLDSILHFNRNSPPVVLKSSGHVVKVLASETLLVLCVIRLLLKISYLMMKLLSMLLSWHVLLVCMLHTHFLPVSLMSLPCVKPMRYSLPLLLLLASTYLCLAWSASKASTD